MKPREALDVLTVASVRGRTTPSNEQIFEAVGCFLDLLIGEPPIGLDPEERVTFAERLCLGTSMKVDYR